MKRQLVHDLQASKKLGDFSKIFDSIYSMVEEQQYDDNGVPLMDANNQLVKVEVPKLDVDKIKNLIPQITAAMTQSPNNPVTPNSNTTGQTPNGVPNQPAQPGQTPPNYDLGTREGRINWVRNLMEQWSKKPR